MLKSIEKDMELEKAFEDGYAKGREESQAKFAEMEHKLYEKCCCLADKNHKLKEDLDSMETEFIRLRAQMDVVYLIFGRK